MLSRGLLPTLGTAGYTVSKPDDSERKVSYLGLDLLNTTEELISGDSLVGDAEHLNAHMNERRRSKNINEIY